MTRICGRSEVTVIGQFRPPHVAKGVPFSYATSKKPFDRIGRSKTDGNGGAESARTQGLTVNNSRITFLG